MRKILLILLTTLLCSVTAWGVEITINRFTGSGATIWPLNTTTMLLQDEVDFVYNNGEDASFSSGALSVAASSTTTISAHGKTITGMTIVFNNANTSSTVNTGTITGWTNSNKTMAWSGSATSITITSGVATRINSAVITYTDASPLSDISSTTLSSFSRIYQSNSIAIVGLSKSPSAPGVNISGAFDSNTKLNNNATNGTNSNAIRIVSPRAISSIVYTWSTAPTTTAVSSGSYDAETSTWTAPNENTTSVDLYNRGTAKAVLSNIVVNFVGGGSCTNVGISTQPTSPVAAIVGSASSITGLVASGTSPSYQWYTCNSDGSGATAIEAAGAMSFTGYTTATLGLTPTAAGTTYYRCVVSGECGAPVTSDVVTVNAATAYTLTWNLNGGKVTTAGTGAAVDATGTPSIALAAGATITPPVVARDYYSFNGWSPDPDDDENEMPGENTTYTAQWTALYATGTYTFENNASAGTAPNRLTMTDASAVAVAAGSRVDNLFFSAQSITYESGIYGGDGDDFKGWKIKTNDATISFLVENDCDVTFGVGTINGAVVSYTNQSGTPVNNSALTAKTDNTFSVKGGTVVTFKTTTASTNTLKKIAITAACTSHSVTAATGTGDNSRGTVSAASATVCEGSTTTVTAVPAAGYQVTNWAVSDDDNGAYISPTGASSSTSTTLTMGTADATVTVTFGCVAPTSPSISGTTAYTAGQDISLTAIATGISASATYTWYKGEEWDDASATSSIHSGAELSIDDCVEDNAGTYWCEISNGTGCNAHASKTITVGPACTDPELTITLN